MSKKDFLEYHIPRALVEADGFDLIAMGRPEGPGCYCYANNLIRKIMDVLSNNYPFMLIDNEAGMEHLSRRTTRNVNLLILVADASQRGLETVARIAELAGELRLNIRRQGVVIGRLPGEANQDYSRRLQERGLELLGSVPHDLSLQQWDMEGRPLLNLSPSSQARRAVSSLVDNLPL
jgi:CO dehydrogenase maturation factor